MRLTQLFVTSSLAGLCGISSLVSAQATASPRARAESRASRTLSEYNDARDRGFLGVSTGSSGVRDTLGLLITSITSGSAAEKAGLEEGNRLAAINGVSLRIASADAGEADMRGLTTRRLEREMQKTKPGDDVELRVYAGGQFKNVKVKVGELPERSELMRFTSDDRRSERESRPALGLGVSSTGSRRDSLGLLVTRVATDGPAEKAGLVEGDRIASINGVDLRVARDDAGDRAVASAKLNRFFREARKLKVGETAELRVVNGGSSRTVKVTAVRAGDLKDEGWGFMIGDGWGMEAPMPAMPAMPSMPSIAPIAPGAFAAPRIFSPGRVRVQTRGAFDDDGDGEFDVDVDPSAIVDGLLPSLRNIGPELGAALREALPRAQMFKAPSGGAYYFKTPAPNRIWMNAPATTVKSGLVKI